MSTHKTLRFRILSLEQITHGKKHIVAIKDSVKYGDKTAVEDKLFTPEDFNRFLNHLPVGTDITIVDIAGNKPE